MNDLLVEQTTLRNGLYKGRVLAVESDGLVTIGIPVADGAERRISCGTLERLEHGDALGNGAEVVVAILANASPVVLGKLQGAPQPTSATSRPSLVPETLLLEATKELVLRVGDGSITIRGDGKILIKGKDLVSSAQRMNRIKGGAVSIN